MAASVNIGDIVSVWPIGKQYLVTGRSGFCFTGIRMGETIMLTIDLCYVTTEAKDVTEKMANAFKNKPKTFWQRVFSCQKKQVKPTNR